MYIYIYIYYMYIYIYIYARVYIGGSLAAEEGTPRGSWSDKLRLSVSLSLSLSLSLFSLSIYYRENYLKSLWNFHFALQSLRKF